MSLPEKSVNNANDAILKQSEEAIRIALRMVNYQSRKGMGGFYLAMSVFEAAALITLRYTRSPFFLILLFVLGSFMVWYITRRAGLRGFGKNGETLSLLSGTRSHLRTLIWIAIIAPWPVDILLLLTGFPAYHVLPIMIWISVLPTYEVLIIKIRLVLRVPRKPEDYAFIISIVLAAFLFLVPEISTTGFAIATPIWAVSGIMSLYESRRKV